MSDNKPSVTLSLPDVMYDPTWVGMSDFDYEPEDIEDPETQVWDWDNV